MTLRAGELLGRYQILCPIGAGGMAEVYAARIVGAERFAKLVAVKVMLPHLSRDPKFARMFVEEARLAADIESAHVVATLDLGKDERAGLYQVMELVLGCSLRQLLDASDDPVPEGIALTILAELARGLADAHAARGPEGAPLGLVHRDVSPHNVLVGVDGRTRLSDFGVARAAASVSATESGELKGKLAYAAPEQLRGEVADARSDVFALGVVAWEVLAGRRLFTADNPLALVDMMMTRPIPRLDEVRPALGSAIADLCAELLVRERGARTLTAAEAASRLSELALARAGSAGRDVLGAFVRERAGPALSALEATIRSQARTLEAPSAADRQAAASARPGGLSRAVGAAVVLLLLGVLGLTIWRGPGADAAGPRSADRAVPGIQPLARRSADRATEAQSPSGERPRTFEPSEAAPEPAERAPSTITPREPPRPREPARDRAARAPEDRPDAGPNSPRVEPTREDERTTTSAETTSPETSPPEVEASPETRASDGLLGVDDFDRSAVH